MDVNVADGNVAFLSMCVNVRLILEKNWILSLTINKITSSNKSKYILSFS